MTIKPRRYPKASTKMKLENQTRNLKALDYCMMVRDSNLLDSELADLLQISERIVRRMRMLDYIPMDERLQKRILKIYLEE